MAGGKLISTGVEFPDATTQTTSGLPLTGGALTGAVTTTSTFDGRDVAADGVTADAALPKAGGTMTGDVSLGDNVKAKFGASDDLQIYHSGSHSYVQDTGTGNLRIMGTELTIANNDLSKKYIDCANGGATDIYYDGSKKLATTSTGIDVTGSVTCDGFTSTGIDDNATSTAITITSDGRGLSQFTAKAWVNFNGTGTVAIRDSHNVSSITDNGTGTYTVNFTNNFANNDYCVSGVASDTSILTIRANDLYHLVSSIQLITRYPVTSAVQDSGYTYLQVFGD